RILAPCLVEPRLEQRDLVRHQMTIVEALEVGHGRPLRLDLPFEVLGFLARPGLPRSEERERAGSDLEQARYSHGRKHLPATDPAGQVLGAYTFVSCGDRPATPGGTPAGPGDSGALGASLAGKRWLRLKTARAPLASARMSRADAQRQLELQVKELYLQAVLA